MATKSKKKKDEPKPRKPGKQPLSEKEPTEQGTIRMPSSEFKDMRKLAKKKAKGNISKYLRELVRDDLKANAV